MTTFKRREVVNTLIGAAAVAALSNPVCARAQGTNSAPTTPGATTEPTFEDLRAFIAVSAALTGIQDTLLAPNSKAKLLEDQKTFARDEHGRLIPDGADPTRDVKLAYFHLASADSSYHQLLLEFQEGVKAHGTDPAGLTSAATKLLVSPTKGVMELARSILMAWYFGVWYEWTGAKPRFTVVSADSYTQGWIWRIAEAHPPGYSNLRFGHWAFPPPAGFDPDTIAITGAPA